MSDTGSVSIKASATVFENVNKALQARIAELEAERDRLNGALSRCVLGDPPGDCYAAEVVDLRAERDRLREIAWQCGAALECVWSAWNAGGRLTDAVHRVDKALMLFHPLKLEPCLKATTREGKP